MPTSSLPPAHRHVTGGLHHRRPVAIVAAAAALSVVAVAVLVIGGTRAAWTARTPDVPGSWQTADLDLGAVVVSFDATGMLPGDKEAGTVAVTNGGDADLGVVVFGENLTATPPTGETAGLDAWLLVSVGTTPGGTEVYTGTLANLPTAFATGAAAGTIAQGGTVTYHVTVELDAATPNAYQATAASVDLVWEGQPPVGP